VARAQNRRHGGLVMVTSETLTKHLDEVENRARTLP
jgi:hypothetical protein